MVIVLASLHGIGVPADQNVVDILKTLDVDGVPVGIVSNNPKPNWFDGTFAGSNVAYLHRRGRQDGSIVGEIAAAHTMQRYNVVVLAASRDDIQMAKNGGAVLVGAGWSTDRYVGSLGIKAADPAALREVVTLTQSWTGPWWYDGQGPTYHVKALADLSSYGKGNAQQVFAQRLTVAAKRGGPTVDSLLTITARSLLTDGFGQTDNLLWGVYPSSNSQNNDQEVLSDFTHRLRTTVSRVRYARMGDPLFIRHTQSGKRSHGGGGNRTDPSEQILTIHLNPVYQGKLAGRNAIVVDDCTTYGVSFAVAAAFLEKAGAASVTGVALGKFGNRLEYQKITINSDPFSPVVAFNAAPRMNFTATRNAGAQDDLTKLI